MGTFLKSVLKKKKKLKYRYGTAVLCYFLAVPVPQKYRRYRYQKSTAVPVPRYFSTTVLPTYGNYEAFALHIKVKSNKKRRPLTYSGCLKLRVCNNFTIDLNGRVLLRSAVRTRQWAL